MNNNINILDNRFAFTLCCVFVLEPCSYCRVVEDLYIAFLQFLTQATGYFCNNSI